MADTKISALTDRAALAADDAFPVVSDPTGTPANHRTSLDTLKNAIRPIWHVDSVNGDDGADGKTESTPFLTIARLATVVGDDDRVRLRCGSVWREEMDLGGAKRLDIQPYGVGALPTISGRDVVPAGDFAAHSGNVYTATITLDDGIVGSRGYPGFFENGVRLIEFDVADGGDEAGTIALVEATPGSFYFAGPGTYLAGWSAGEKTYYVHPFGSTNPTSDGKVYEAYKRRRVLLHAYFSDSFVEGIQFVGGWHHDGVALTRCHLRRVHIRDFARHGNLCDSVFFEDCVVSGPNPKYPGGYYHMNRTVFGDDDNRYLRSRAVGDPANPVGIGFFSHGDSIQMAWKRIVLADCVAENCSSAFSHNDVEIMTLVRCKARNCTTYVPSSNRRNRTEIIDCDFRGATYRPIGGSNPSGGTYDVVIRRSYIECRDASAAFYETAAVNSIDIEDSVIVIAPSAITGVDRAMAYVGGAVASIRLSRSVVAVQLGSMDTLVNVTGTLGSLTVDDIVIPPTDQGGNDATYRVSGSTVTLDGAAGVSRLTISESSRSALVDAMREKFVPKEGVYFPGMRRFNGVCQPGGATQPRKAVAVGDEVLVRSATALESWETRYTPSNELLAVAFCGDGHRMYSACGRSGEMCRSGYDGYGSTGWVSVTSGTSENLRGIAFALATSVGVAVGDNGTILRTTDGGQTWTAATTPGTSENLYCVTSDGTTWIAAGDAGVVVTSTNGGDTWTASTVGSVRHTALEWVAGLSLFFLGSQIGAIRTSPATIAWTSRTTYTRNTVSSFGYGQGKLIATLLRDSQSGPDMIWSTDGITWQAVPVDLPFDPLSITSPLTAYIGHSFVAVGHSAYAAYSQDGLHWHIRKASVYEALNPMLGTSSSAADVAAEFG